MDRDGIEENVSQLQTMSRTSSSFQSCGEKKGTVQTPKHRPEQANFFRKGL